MKIITAVLFLFQFINNGIGQSDNSFNLILLVSGEVPGEGSISNFYITSDNDTIHAKYLPGEILLNIDTSFGNMIYKNQRVKVHFSYLPENEHVEMENYDFTFEIGHLNQRYCLIEVFPNTKSKFLRKHYRYKYRINSPICSLEGFRE
ncbi:MAG: hypothetical protein R2879_18045 [Saprospiraceae bacterium]